MTKPEIVGYVREEIAELLELSGAASSPLLLGESNIEHMKKEHPEDYEKYGDRLIEIITNPDFVAKHPKNGSIQYIKVFHDYRTNEHVLVAVRASKNDVFFIRSLFVMSEEKKRKYNEKGALIAVKEK